MTKNYGEEIQVGSDDQIWARANSPDLLYSGGFGPCLIVTLYDEVNKDGYMWHSPHCDDGLETMLEEATKASKDLKVWVRGGAVEPDNIGAEPDLDVEDYRNAVLSERELLLKTMKKYLPEKSLDVQFLETKGYSGDVTLDTETGEFSEDYEDSADENEFFF